LTAEIQAKHEAESKSFGDRLGSILDRKNAGSGIWVFVGEVQLEFIIHIYYPWPSNLPKSDKIV
jgi:hypothetical protein